MKIHKILSILAVSFLIFTRSYAAEAERLPGKVVFRTDRFDGKWAICTLVDGKVKKISNEGVNPRWSPDGERIAIARHGQDWAGIIILDENGKNEVRYPTEWGPFMLDWLPDGQSIIFSSDRKLGGKQETGNLFRYDLTAKTTTQLTFFDDGKTISGLAVSPDGKKMIFLRYVSGDAQRTSQYYIADIDGTNVEELSFKPSDPAWSPDGRKIVYTSGWFRGEWYGKGAIQIYDFQNREERIVKEREEQGVIYSQPVFSPDGTQILFSRWSGLYVVNLDGTGLKTILPPKRLSADESSSDVEPDWTA